MPYVLTATNRTATGRRAKHVMDEGLIPAVIYGHNLDSHNIQLNASDFRKILREAGGSSLVDLTLDQATPVKVLIKAVQVHPISMKPVHVDLYQIRMDEELEVEVPIKLIGESKAVKEMAGTLVQSMDTVEVKCLPADLPHEIIVDIAKLATFEDSITIADLNLPKGVVALDEATATVATVAAPLTEEQLKKLEEGEARDVSSIKTEAEEKKAEEEAKKAEEAKAAE